MQVMEVFILYVFSLLSNFFSSTDFNSYGPVKIAETTAVRKQGFLAAPIAPGLGVELLYEVLGQPVFVVGRI